MAQPVPRQRAKKYRNWCFRLTEPTYDETDFFLDMLQHGHEKVMYVSVQSEVGEETHKFHFQGYMELKGQSRMSAMKNNFGQRVHWEKRMGTQRQADEYTKKNETYQPTWGYGPAFVRGIRGDWGKLKRGGSDRFELAVEHLKTGGSMEQLKEDYSVQYAMHKDKLSDYYIGLKGRRHWPMEVEIFVGETGSGKSATAWRENPQAYACPWPIGGHWWMGGYQGENTIILDDYDGQISLEKMMMLFDRHPWPDCEAKCRQFNFVSKKIVITTNRDPRDWFPKHDKDEIHMRAMRRRIREFASIRDFDDGHEYPDFVESTRMDMDDFDWNDRRNGRRGTIPAGVGDMSSGNGFLDFNMGGNSS